LEDLTSRKSRSKLAVRPAIYWKTLKPGELALGCLKLKAGEPCVWIMRTYVGKDTGKASPYVKENLGIADDYPSIEGLSFVEAQTKAFEKHALREKQKKAGVQTGPLTVADLAGDYLAYLKAAGQKTGDAKRRIDTHILPAFGKTKVEDLKTHAITKWHHRMAATAAQLRPSKDGKQQYKAAPDTDDDEAMRPRRATANRTLTVLKAILNRAFKQGRVAEDTEWRRVAPFKGVDAARPGYLSVPEAQRLINAADPDFRLVIQAALHTGARYGELCRLKVADFEHECIVVRKSKTTKTARDVELSDEAVAFFAQLCVGRRKDATLLLRSDGEPWGPSHQARRMAEACKRAGIEPLGIHALRHSYASLSIMANVPVLSVARNLGHADTRMCEKFYGHLTKKYQRGVIRAGAPTFGIVQESNVVPLKETA